MNKDTREQMVRDIRELLQQEPGLSDPTKIIVNLEKRGGLLNKHHVVAVEGKVKNLIESKKAEQVIQSKLGERLDLENRLTVNGQ